uniref:C-type lectin domain-containing protein n=1 Tax=Ascaris lumbricoides TaxID=6252 RepID=A0A9J2NZS2_ASCLU
MCISKKAKGEQQYYEWIYLVRHTLKSASGLLSTTFAANATVPSTSSSYYAERACACQPSKLYLDIVVAIDSSLSMTKEGLIQVAADLATLFLPMNVSSESAQGQFIRVALVAFADNAVIVGDLNKYHNYASLVEGLFTIDYHGGKTLNIEAGLKAASTVLESSRHYAKTVILLYSSAYRSAKLQYRISHEEFFSAGGFADPNAIANQIKESGTKIITIAFRQQPEGTLVKKLGHLSSPNFAFGSMDTSIIAKITNAFCQVNCYCKNNWIQFADDLQNPNSVYGECLRFMDIDASWFAAHFACPAMANGAHLTSELTQHKHDFIHQYAKSAMSTLQWPFEYHIGLHYNQSARAYFWEGPNKTELPYDMASLNYWNSGYPNASAGDCVSVVTGSRPNGGLQNGNCFTKPMRYVCQVAACDTENFCASLED